MEAVSFDRDGVLNWVLIRNGTPYPREALNEIVTPSDAAPALNALSQHRFRLIMVTNLPDIARGKISRSTVAEINRHIRSVLPIDAVEMCEHDDSDNCDCRKPKPGMLMRAVKRDGLDLSASFGG